MVEVFTNAKFVPCCYVGTLVNSLNLVIFICGAIIPQRLLP